MRRFFPCLCLCLIALAAAGCCYVPSNGRAYESPCVPQGQCRLPVSPGRYSEPMHPFVRPDGAPALMPRSMLADELAGGQ